MRIFITGLGILSPLGAGITETRDALAAGKKGIAPLKLFPLNLEESPPAGEITSLSEIDNVPRTHAAALAAASEALGEGHVVPDAIVLGGTTGGMPATEVSLRDKDFNVEKYRYHGTGTVAEYLAEKTGCRGEVITISTACSSGTAAIKLGADLIKQGRARKVLAGGVDALCRLTYHGFGALQVVDPEGARPMDANRMGMTVSEGAGMVLLEGADTLPPTALAEVAGGALSCDAHHPASPHPDGEGALRVMEGALEEAGIALENVDYINLHGTGTRDNDQAESKAIRRLFGDSLPPVSSVKGAFGHSLAAAGAIEAVIAVLCIRDGFIPANISCREPDPELGIVPVLENLHQKVEVVLSNSFGFGGNNASVVFTAPDYNMKGSGSSLGEKTLKFAVTSYSCLTGAGDVEETWEALEEGVSVKGVLSKEVLSRGLNAKSIRRLKRLPRMLLALAESAFQRNDVNFPPSIFFGTGWGPLSETNDFLEKLFKTGEQYSSPTDFVGSVHNAPAAQLAIKYNATGENLTLTGGNFSFEQALFSALVFAKADRDTLCLAGADEYHEQLTRVFDASAAHDEVSADGGGMLFLDRRIKKHDITIGLPWFGNVMKSGRPDLEALIAALGGVDGINEKYAAVFAGLPAGDAFASLCLEVFLSATGFTGEVVYYRKILGEFPAVSSTAAVMAVKSLEKGVVNLHGKVIEIADSKGILIFNTGINLSAIEILREQ